MKRKSILINSSLILFGLLITFSIAEIFLRILPYQRKVLIPPYLYDNHPNTWWTLRPGFSSKQKTLDGTHTIKINNQGIRSAVEYDKLENNLSGRKQVQRIFVIGDSFTFGTVVEEPNTYPRVLEQLLVAQGLNYEVINLGVPGFGTKQSYLRLLEYSSILGVPDIVIYMFCPNDPIDNLVGKKVVFNGIRMDEHIKFKYLAYIVAHIYRYSRTVALVMDTYYTKKVNPRLAMKRKLAKQQVEGRTDVIALIAELKRLVNWTTNKGINLLVMTTFDSEYNAILKKLLLEELDIPMLESQRFFELRNLKPNQIQLENDPHWNPLGHQIIAEDIKVFLVRNEWTTDN